jgi:hypothetical protein
MGYQEKTRLELIAERNALRIRRADVQKQLIILADKVENYEMGKGSEHQYALSAIRRGGGLQLKKAFEERDVELRQIRAELSAIKGELTDRDDSGSACDAVEPALQISSSISKL